MTKKIVPGGKVKLDDKTRRCIECNEPLTKTKINDVLYWICPKGCGRWAPNEKILRARCKNAVTMVPGENYPEPRCGGGAAKGKGSSKSGKKRKKKPKKPDYAYLLK